jgi:hypothetical protein
MVFSDVKVMSLLKGQKNIPFFWSLTSRYWASASRLFKWTYFLQSDASCGPPEKKAVRFSKRRHPFTEATRCQYRKVLLLCFCRFSRQMWGGGGLGLQSEAHKSEQEVPKRRNTTGLWCRFNETVTGTQWLIYIPSALTLKYSGQYKYHMI